MSFIHAIIMAIVEGLTEFLPISSTGHLVLTANILGIPHTDFVKTFEIIIQLGAILAVVVLHWRTLTTNIHVWKRILIAFIPTGILGLTLYKLIKDFLIGNVFITLAALFLGGIVLIVLEMLHKEKEHHNESIESIPLKRAFFIGLFQSLAMVPGVSRAGATIIGGLWLGIKRKTAVEFSFLLALPTMAAATGLDLLESDLTFTSQEFLVIIVGVLGSFLVALAAITFLLRFVKTHTFIPFGIYRILFAAVYFLFFI